MRIIIVMACAIGLAACASHPKQDHIPAAKMNIKLGYAYLARGQVERAELKFNTALNLAPNNALVLKGMGDYYLQTDRFWLAKGFLARAYQLVPSNPEYKNNYAVALCRSGEAQKAVSLFKQLSRNPQYPGRSHAWENALLCEKR